MIRRPWGLLVRDSTGINSIEASTVGFVCLGVWVKGSYCASKVCLLSGPICTKNDLLHEESSFFIIGFAMRILGSL